MKVRRTSKPDRKRERRVREAAKLLNLTVAEAELVSKIGARWLRMTTDEILSENAVLFRLAVAIVGMKHRLE